MYDFPPVPALTRLSIIIDALCRAVAARSNPRIAKPWAPALILLVWTRLRRAETLLKALAAQFYAGKLRVITRTSNPNRPARRTAPANPLPRRFAWLLPLLQNQDPGYVGVVGCAGQLGALLADPEMQALIAASPRARRILGPTCRMLGIDPALLAPAKPTPEPPTPEPPTPEPPTPVPAAAHRPSPADPPPPPAPPYPPGIRPCANDPPAWPRLVPL